MMNELVVAIVDGSNVFSPKSCKVMPRIEAMVNNYPFAEDGKDTKLKMCREWKRFSNFVKWYEENIPSEYKDSFFNE